MSKKSNSSKGRTFWRRLGKIVLILFAISVLLPILYRWVNPPVTTFQCVQAVKNGTGIHKKWVPIEKISPYMYRAAIASEDNYFLGHNGFDVIALNTVMEERKSGRRKRGGSTISQQTAKNVFCWPKSSWVRKGVETYFTFLIETFWSKERIMEVYLNVIEMGPGIYGAEKAAQTYFKPGVGLVCTVDLVLGKATEAGNRSVDIIRMCRSVTRYAPSGLSPAGGIG